jgi:ABC-type sugar transport system ATPase subunit
MNNMGEGYMGVVPQPNNATNDVPLLYIKGASKAFGHVQALDSVDFDVYAGEVVALVGDNGAGKSTLIKILSGVYSADQCEIYVDGHLNEIRDPNDAQRLGLATVYQDLALVDDRDVASNIYLGIEPMRWIIIDRHKMFADAEQILSILRTTIPSVRTQAKLLSGGQRQAVAIARALVRGSRMFIMDEPTAALGVEEARKVLDLIGDLKQRGAAVVIVSHNIAHVFQVADRIVVLRHGKRVGSRQKCDTTPEEIVGLITGAIEKVGC